MELFFDISQFKEGVRRSDHISLAIFMAGLIITVLGMWLASSLPSEQPLPIAYFSLVLGGPLLVVAGACRAAMRHGQADTFYAKALVYAKIDEEKVRIQTADMAERTFSKKECRFERFPGHGNSDGSYWMRIYGINAEGKEGETQFCLGYSKDESDALFHFLSLSPADFRHDYKGGVGFAEIPALPWGSTDSAASDLCSEFVLPLTSFGPDRPKIVLQMGMLLALASVALTAWSMGNDIAVMIFIPGMAAALLGGFLLYWFHYKVTVTTLTVSAEALTLTLPDGSVAIYPYGVHTFRQKIIRTR